MLKKRESKEGQRRLSGSSLSSVLRQNIVFYFLCLGIVTFIFAIIFHCNAGLSSFLPDNQSGGHFAVHKHKLWPTICLSITFLSTTTRRYDSTDIKHLLWLYQQVLWLTAKTRLECRFKKSKMYRIGLHCQQPGWLSVSYLSLSRKVKT